MTLNELIEELENARNAKGGDSEVWISCQKKSDENGMSELVTCDILDIIFSEETKNIAIWVRE